MRKIVLFISLFFLVASLEAQIVKEKPLKRGATVFAIFTDSKTFEKTKGAIHKYRDAVENDGLSTYIYSADWKNPEQIRNELKALYKDEPTLEGVVFIGDIPVALIRNAQHLTTAFKMDEVKFPFPESSVPSDRFYDDLHLSFEYISQDATQPQHFYYKLSETSPQDLHPDFYSARIKYPEKKGGDKYEAIAVFLNKAADFKKEKNNKMDNFVSFTGSGYNSECLIAWADEMKAYRENFPLAWKSNLNARQLNFRMDDFMKYKLLNQLQRPEVDLFMFHEHGLPEKQLINNEVPGSSFDSRYDNVRSDIFVDARKSISNGKITLDSLKNYYVKTYGLQNSFFDSLYSKGQIRKDSIRNADIYINLSDLSHLNTYPKFVMLDACYNGSFHLNNYVAGYYLFNGGNTLVVQGNSRNVLQDRWTIEMIGLLSYGVRAGQYNRLIATLEGHLFGDPTAHFASAVTGDIASDMILKSNDEITWKHYLKSDYADIQSLSLRMLADNDKQKGFSSFLLETFKESKFNTVRMEALKLLSRYANADFTQAVAIGLNDSYELVVRQAASYAGRIGAKNLLKPMADIYINQSEKQRVAYSLKNSFEIYPLEDVLKSIKEAIENSNLLDKQKVLKEISADFTQSSKQQKKGLGIIMNPNADIQKRISEIRLIRNNNYHFMLDDYLKLLSDDKENVTVKVALAEALGWFNYSYRKGEIIETCNKLIAAGNVSPEFSKELIQTINRLK
ncbi:HEAT repeat domain-containing protein [uncultured Bacteroides sp.]|uniref:HEAT repeat domain-containing protein n=1 Tax=uncultured Bacteroides sp. TaxID=162156 RepID=UPI002AAB323E|nr:HEAT repeat domain-containing protein [uncultured Bacteroides sp.]